VDRDWRAEFERTYTGSPSAVQERVWRQVFGDEYPEGLDPYSYVTVSELDRFVHEVRLKKATPSSMQAAVAVGQGSLLP